VPDLETAVKYVAAAYLVVWVAILIYVWLIGQKVGRIEAELARLERELEVRPPAPSSAPPARDPEAVA
jgi:CcmD family protein